MVEDRARFEKDTNRYKWKGIIIARTWDAAMTEADYIAMQAGSRKALYAPDGVTAFGKPMWHHTTYKRREIETVMDRYCLDKLVFENVACNAGRSSILTYIGGAAGLLGVTYFAVGTGTPVSPSNGDTQLVSEQFRKLLTSSTLSGNSVVLACFFLAAEGNYNYTEAGAFGTASASGTANSGVLFAHTLYAYNKTNAVSLTNDYTVYMN